MNDILAFHRVQGQSQLASRRKWVLSKVHKVPGKSIKVGSNLDVSFLFVQFLIIHIFSFRTKGGSRRPLECLYLICTCEYMPSFFPMRFSTELD